ncbi:MAG: hypothetical protein AMXMBFR23_00480 [Chloroflexota bacterium]
MRLGRHHVIIGVSVIAGVLFGVFVFQTDPAVLGWVFGLGMGLLGGAFIAAVTSGEAIAGSGEGPRSRRGRRSAAPWLEDDDDGPAAGGAAR